MNRLLTSFLLSIMWLNQQSWLQALWCGRSFEAKLSESSSNFGLTFGAVRSGNLEAASRKSELVPS